MDNQQQTEYDFFMRAAALFEDRAVALAGQADSIFTADLYRRCLTDAQNARLWAERIQAGWRMVNRD